MFKYEVTFLVNEEADVQTVKDNLNSSSGKILEEKAWGKRTLTYPINKKTAAYYFTWKIEIDRKGVSDFKRKLNFNNQLVRYLLLIQQ